MASEASENVLLHNGIYAYRQVAPKYLVTWIFTCQLSYYYVPKSNFKFRGCLRPIWPQMSNISLFSSNMSG